MLPSELYRPIVELADREDLFTLLTVSRILQSEVERLLYRDFILCWTRDEVKDACGHLLSAPRLCGLIRSLCIRVESNSDCPGDLYDVLASLFEKTTELVYLAFDILSYEETPEWDMCGVLFERCAFQLHILRCNFILDAAFESFLAKQRSLIEWDWSPQQPSSHTLSSTALPNLSIFSTYSIEGTEFPLRDSIFRGRPITHVSWWRGSIIPSDIGASTAEIKVLHLGWHVIESMKDSLVELFPYLECLSYVHYNLDEQSCYFQGLHRLKHLRAVEVYIDSSRPDGKEVATSLYKRCPSLRQIFIESLSVKTLHEWDDRRFSWKVPRDVSRLDIWADWVREAHPDCDRFNGRHDISGLVEL